MMLALVYTETESQASIKLEPDETEVQFKGIHQNLL